MSPILVVLIVLLAGCGPSDESSNSNQANVSTSDEPATEKTLTQAEKWEQVELPTPVPESTPELLKRGKELYNGKLACRSCHGPNGNGNGPAASNLTNTKTGDPISPRDFNDPKQFKWGSSRQAIARTILTGGKNPGSPMPPMQGAVSPEELWAVSSYVYSFRNQSSTEEGQ